MIARYWGFCLKPQPHIQGKTMNKYMAPKQPNLPCFEALGVILCPDLCLYFCFVCGGPGVTSVFLRYVAQGRIAQMCLCETRYQGGSSHHLGGVLTSLQRSEAQP